MDVEILNERKLQDGKMLRVEVRIAPDDKAPLVREALHTMAQEARVSPDEGGDIRSALEQRFSKEAVSQAVTGYLAAMAAASVVNQRDLHIMFSPEPVVKQAPEDQLHGPDPIVMQIDLVLRPEYELSDYGPLTVPPVTAPDISDEMIDAAVAQNVDELATMEPDDGPLAVGDFALLDMDTKMNAEQATGLSGKSMRIVLSPDMMPSGFIDNVVGMVEGDVRDFKFATAPQGGAKDAAPDVFEVHAKCLGKRKRVVPELTDELVQEHFAGMGATVAQYREAVRTQLEENLVEQQKAQREVQLDALLSKRLEGSIDDLYLERTRDEILENMRQQLAAQGMSLEDYARHQGVDEQSLMLGVSMQARESLRQNFALDAYWRQMGEELVDADLERAIHEMSPGREEEARQNFDHNGAWFVVREMAARMRAHDEVMAKAVFE